MSFLSKLFVASIPSKPALKLQDIELLFLGLRGEDQIKLMETRKDYEGMKNQALKMYNAAENRFSRSNKVVDLEAMYATWKNYEACELMCYYHDQIIALMGKDVPEHFEVQLGANNAI